MANATNAPQWLTDVSTAVANASNVAQTQNEVEDLTSARSDFAELMVELRRLTEADALGRGTWWQGQTAEPDVFNELAKASTDPQTRVVNSLLRRLDAFAGAVNTQMIASWREYAAGRMGNVADLQLLASTLAGIDRVAGLAENLQNALGQLGQVQGSVPTPRTMALLDQTNDRLAELEAALQPTAVREFLSAVAGGGASLALLTDEVRAWLAANRAEFRFKIVAGVPVTS